MRGLVVVSNRVQVPRGRTPQAGGLAVALRGALQEYGGTWVGWDGRVDHLPGETTLSEYDGVNYATFPLSSADYEGYYAGYSNEVLWPLFHFLLDTVDYHREHRDRYHRVNRDIAQRILPLLKGDELIWIHDYHLIPLARELRRLGVTQPIGFFLHIPFPSFGLLRALPGYKDMLQALTYYDLVGLQTPGDLRACRESLRFGLAAEPVSDEDGRSIVRLGHRELRLGVFPVGIDVDELADLAARSVRSRRVNRLTGMLGERDLVIGVDRLDYSKGLLNRFGAFERLLEEYRRWRGRTVFM